MHGGPVLGDGLGEMASQGSKCVCTASVLCPNAEKSLGLYGRLQTSGFVGSQVVLVVGICARCQKSADALLMEQSPGSLYYVIFVLF